MKRIISVILALAMVFSMTIYIGAADNGKVTVESISADPGETVEVKVKLENNPGIAVLAIKVAYSSDLTLISAVDHDTLGEDMHGKDYTANPYNLTWNNMDDYSTNGDLVTLTFKVSDTAQAGSELDIDLIIDEDIYNINEEFFTFDIVDGKVTVTGTSVHTHSMTHHEAVAANCHEGGTVEYWFCSGCQKNYAEEAGTTELAKITTEIDLTNHDGETEVRGKVDATETTPGYTGDTYCLGCNTKIATGTETPVLTHTHSMTYHAAVVANCHEGGTVEYWYCSGCQKNYADEAGTTELAKITTDIDLTNHDGETEVRGKVDATETTPGYTGDTYCLGCNTKIATGTEIPVQKNGKVTVESVSAEAGETVDVKVKLEDNPGIAVLSIKVAYSNDLTLIGAVDHDILGEDMHGKDYTANPYNLTWNNMDDYSTNGDLVTLSFKVNDTVQAGSELDIDLIIDEDIYNINEEFFTFDIVDGKITVTGMPAHTHSMTHHAAVAANCHEEGTVEYWYCSGCKKNYADEAGTTELAKITTDIDLTNHDGETEVRGKVDATETTPGYTGDTYCLGCNTKIVTGTETPVLTHTHSMTYHAAVAANCHEGGTVEYWFCSGCQKNYAEEAGTTELAKITTDLDLTNHDGETEVRGKVDATETTPGYTGDTYCLGCNTKIATGTETPVLTHTHSMTYHAAVAANCHEGGTVEYWFCSGCQKNYAEEAGTMELAKITTEIDPTNHDGETEVRGKVDATETTPGYTGDTYCLGCNAKIATGTEIPVLTHTHKPVGDWKFDTDYHWHECSGCEEKVDKTAHTAGSWIIDKQATETKTGLKHKKCVVCGYVLEIEEIPVVESGFDFDDWYWIMAQLMNQKFTITAEAGIGGSISNEGKSTVKYNNSITYYITPADGYEIEAVYVNGKSIGATNVYTFKNVRSNQNISVTFVKTGWDNPFIDIADDAEYIDAIEFVYENNLFKGVSETEFIFAPMETMTRGMFVTVLGRLADVNAIYYTGSSFDDVVEGEWYAPYVEWAAEKGIVLGYGDGRFGVNDKITVEQATVILARYAEYADEYEESNISLKKYADADKVSDWALEAMKWAVDNDIYTGESGKLNPQNPAPRALIATMIYNYAKEFEGEE